MATEKELIPPEFEVFKRALDEDDVQIKIGCIENLPSLVRLIGEEPAINIALPYVIANIPFHENDEILIKFLKQFTTIIPLSGGYRNSKIFLDFLEEISEIDDPLVQDEIVFAATEICHHLEPVQCEEIFLPFLNSLHQKNGDGSKISASALLSVCYTKLDEEHKRDLRNIIKVLCQDESQFVRKRVAENLQEFISILEPNYVKSMFISITENFSDDVTDIVRVVSVDVLIAISKQLPPEDVIKYNFPLLERLFEDSSWKVRQKLATSLPHILSVMPLEAAISKLVEKYKDLTLEDIEAEVRIAGAKAFYSFCTNLKNVSDKFLQIFTADLLGIWEKLLLNSDGDIKYCLTENFLTFCSILSEDVFLKNVLSLVEKILNNEQDIKAQQHILSKLHLMPMKFNEDMLKATLSAIKNVMNNATTNWRCRRDLLPTFLFMAHILDKKTYLEELGAYYLQLLQDKYCSVRRTAPIILPSLTLKYGTEFVWNFLAEVLEFQYNSKYLNRFIPLYAIEEFLKPSLNLNIFSLGDESDQKKLARISKYLSKAQEKLATINDKENYVSNENINLYLEDSLADLDKCHENIEFGQKSILEDVLILINKSFISTVNLLIEDKIINVQLRASKTLGILKEFLNKVNEEVSLLKIPENILKEVEEEVENELSKTLPKLEKLTIANNTESNKISEQILETIDSAVEKELRKEQENEINDKDYYPEDLSLPSAESKVNDKSETVSLSLDEISEKEQKENEQKTSDQSNKEQKEVQKEETKTAEESN